MELPSEDALSLAAAQLLANKPWRTYAEMCEAFWDVYSTLMDERSRWLERQKSREMLESQRQEFETQVRPLMDEVLQGMRGKVKGYVLDAVATAFRWGGLRRHPKEVPDDELLACRGIGQKSLAHIRAVYPYAGGSTHESGSVPA